jgi:hypothetical protein
MMKKVAGFMLISVLSHSALADNMDVITKNVQAACLSPSQAGKYWTATEEVKGGINGLIRLVTAGINGEATFTQGEWNGVQQVLQTDRAGDNKGYRQCVEKLMPLFLEKFTAPAPVTHSQTKTKPKVKPDAAKSEPAKAGNHAETHGDTSPAIVGDGSTINY